ncbi:MAG: hypothetical protein ABGX49_05745, partial [Candidatus Poseidoniia archaeon]
MNARIQKDGSWKITKSQLHHACAVDACRQSMHSTSATTTQDISMDAQAVVAVDGAGRVHGAAKRLQARLSEKGMGTVPSWKLAESLRRARSAMFGDMSSVSRTALYLRALIAADVVPGLREESDTYVKLMTQPNDGTNHYFRMFIAPGPAVRIARAAPLKPYLTHDGTFCKFRFRRERRALSVGMGCVLTLVASDADGSLLPLAVGHCEGETRATWTWFFEQCKAAFGNDSIIMQAGVILAADGDKGGVSAAEEVLEHALRMYCLKHRQVRRVPACVRLLMGACGACGVGAGGGGGGAWPPRFFPVCPGLHPPPPPPHPHQCAL